jgi:cytochrome P450
MPAPDPVDLSSLSFWAQPLEQRAAAFAELREQRPVSWHRAPEGLLMPDPDAAGFWAVTRHAEIEFLSKNGRLFCSGQGVQFQDVPEGLLEASQSFLAMDDPRHTRLRKLVSAAFTPKQVDRIEEQIARRAEAMVQRFVEHGDGDLVERLARPLPMWGTTEQGLCRVRLPTLVVGNFIRGVKALPAKLGR